MFDVTDNIGDMVSAWAQVGTDKAKTSAVLSQAEYQATVAAMQNPEVQGHVFEVVKSRVIDHFKTKTTLGSEGNAFMHLNINTSEKKGK